jgi:hypothetical protein
MQYNVYMIHIHATQPQPSEIKYNPSYQESMVNSVQEIVSPEKEYLVKHQMKDLGRTLENMSESIRRVEKRIASVQCFLSASFKYPILFCFAVLSMLIFRVNILTVLSFSFLLSIFFTYSLWNIL